MNSIKKALGGKRSSLASNILVTEKSGNLLLVSGDGESRVLVQGVPKVAYGGQGGLGDVILHPEYGINQLVYISYAEKGLFGRRGGAVVRGIWSLGH